MEQFSSMLESDALSSGAEPPILRKLLMLGPVAAALSYPYFLGGFHLAVAPRAGEASTIALAWAAACLLGALAVPLVGLACAAWLSRTEVPSRWALRARRVAYISIAAPPLYVFVGVTRGLIGVPVDDTTLWIASWLAAGVYVWQASADEIAVPTGSVAGWRVAHGVVAALLAAFFLFHLANHLFGLMGPDVHAGIMKSGRSVYRSPFVEPVFVAVLLFQVVLGARLAWRWSAARGEIHRVFQIGSGVYLALFIVTHLNSALVAARGVRGIETDWAWASGAPAGLIHDAWNIRLLPHYAFGAFFILAHLCTGLRHILLAHGVAESTANRMWVSGLIASGLVSSAIIGALCGVRI